MSAWLAGTEPHRLALLMPDHCTRCGVVPILPIRTKSRTVVTKAAIGGVPPSAVQRVPTDRSKACGASTPFTAMASGPNWVKRHVSSPPGE